MQKQIEKLYKPLYLYVRKRISNPLDAEDLTQEVFYKLSKSNTDNIENIKSWVYAIAKNTITDYYKKKKYTTDEIKNIAIDEASLGDDVINELSNCIAPFIAQLPKDYRLIMSLSELESIPQKEIAEKLEMNYTTVRSKVQRGRRKLKDLISNCCTVTQGGKGSILGYKKNKGCSNDC